MTVIELRFDIMRQGYFMHEDINGTVIRIEIGKLDTDGLRFTNQLLCDANEILNGTQGEEKYMDIMRELTRIVNEAITNRHAQNINNCEHNEIMIGTKKSCTKCMGKFGERMSLDMNWN